MLTESVSDGGDLHGRLWVSIMSYSQVVLDHFYSPRHNAVMAKPDAVGVSGDPGRGNFMVIYLRIEGGRIAEASFQTHGCCPAIAAGSLLAERLTGAAREDAERWTEPAIDEALGGLPVHKRYCSALAAAALMDALGKWREKARERKESTTWDSH